MSIILTDDNSGSKRIVKKKKENTEKMNIKISTDDRDFFENSLNKEKNNEVEKSKEEPKTQRTLKTSGTVNVVSPQDNLTILSNKLQQIEAARLSEEQIYMNENKDLNEQIEEKNKEIKQISIKVKKSLNELMEMKDNLDNQVNNLKLTKKKKEKKLKDDKELIVGIKSAEKSKKTMIKNKELEERQLLNVQQLLEENESGQEHNLNNQLSELKKTIKSLENEVTKLKTIQSQHNHCEKYISQLKSRLNIMSNEVEFEIKKQNMIETSNTNTSVNDTIENNQEKIVLNLKQSASLNENKKKAYGDKIRIKKTVLKKPKGISLNQSYLSDYWRQLDSSKENKVDTTPNFPTEDEKSELLLRKSLFTTEETDILQQLIPGDYLNNYREKYSYLYNQAVEIKEKMKENDDIKTKINKQKNDIDETEQKNRMEERTLNTLTSNLNKYKKESFMANKKIKQLSKLLKTQNDLLAEKNKQNEELQGLLKEVNKKIKKGRLILKTNQETKTDNKNNKESKDKDNKDKEPIKSK